MDWYDRKNTMYESSYEKQDRSLLVGNLYKGTFENGEEAGVKLNRECKRLNGMADAYVEGESNNNQNGLANGVTDIDVGGELKADLSVEVTEITDIAV
jgi:hypothetical protein